MKHCFPVTISLIIPFIIGYFITKYFYPSNSIQIYTSHLTILSIYQDWQSKLLSSMLGDHHLIAVQHHITVCIVHYA